MKSHAARIAGTVERCACAAKRLLGLVLLAMVALNVANAFGRYVLGRAIVGADEILVFAMAWLVFLGAALVTWHGRHLSVDVIDQIVPGPARRLRDAVVLALTAVLGGFVVVQAVDVMVRLTDIGQVSMAARIPMAIPHGSIAVGFVLIVLLAVLRLVVGRDGKPRRGSRAADDAGTDRGAE